jgi:hypothetical protein
MVFKTFLRLWSILLKWWQAARQNPVVSLGSEGGTNTVTPTCRYGLNCERLPHQLRLVGKSICLYIVNLVVLLNVFVANSAKH